MARLDSFRNLISSRSSSNSVRSSVATDTVLLPTRSARDRVALATLASDPSNSIRPRRRVTERAATRRPSQTPRTSTMLPLLSVSPPVLIRALFVLLISTVSPSTTKVDPLRPLTEPSRVIAALASSPRLRSSAESMSSATIMPFCRRPSTDTRRPALSALLGRSPRLAALASTGCEPIRKFKPLSAPTRPSSWTSFGSSSISTRVARRRPWSR